MLSNNQNKLVYNKAFRVVLIVAALLAELWFPYPLAVVLMVVVGIYEPLAAVACGLLADSLYYMHGLYPFPFMTLLGILIALASRFVRKFIEARIIGG